MKSINYFILTIMLCCQILTGLSQQTSLSRDANGNQSALASYNSTLPLQPTSLLSVLSFDSIRSLTEITNPTEAEAFPWISPDGLRLYYTNGADSDRLYYTSRANINSYFNTPVLVPISISGISSYWFSDDELDIYCCAGNIYHAHRNSVSSPFNTPAQLNMNLGPIAPRSASLDSSQNTMFVTLFGIPYQGINEFTRTSPTSFTHVRLVGTPPGVAGYIGQLSKDDLTYIFTVTVGSTTKLYSMERATVLDTFDVATYSEVQNINDPAYRTTQPSVSDNMNWIVFVRNLGNIWENNDLYIASKAGVISSVFEPGSPEAIHTFPNPVENELYVSGSGSGTFEMLDISGRKICSGNLFNDQPNKIITSEFPTGVYVLNILSGKWVTSKKIVVARK